MPKGAIDDRLRKPWAMVPPAVFFLARSASTWIHWLSPVHAANWSIMDWSTVTQWDLPRSWPMKSLIAASVTFAIAIIRCSIEYWHIPKYREEDHDDYVERRAQY